MIDIHKFLVLSVIEVTFDNFRSLEAFKPNPVPLISVSFKPKAVKIVKMIAVTLLKIVSFKGGLENLKSVYCSIRNIINIYFSNDV